MVSKICDPSERIFVKGVETTKLVLNGPFEQRPLDPLWVTTATTNTTITITPTATTHGFFKQLKRQRNCKTAPPWKYQCLRKRIPFFGGVHPFSTLCLSVFCSGGDQDPSLLIHVEENPTINRAGFHRMFRRLARLVLARKLSQCYTKHAFRFPLPRKKSPIDVGIYLI